MIFNIIGKNQTITCGTQEEFQEMLSMASLDVEIHNRDFPGDPWTIEIPQPEPILADP